MLSKEFWVVFWLVAIPLWFLNGAYRRWKEGG